MQMDVILLTKDSMRPCLPECLDAIETAASQASVDVRLLVIDCHSTDGTCEEVLHHTSLRPTIIVDDGNRATARQAGIDLVSTELFAFIDSDAIVTPSWFEHMLHYFIDPKVGAVWGATVATDKAQKDYMDAMARIYRTTPLILSLRYGQRRGMTHDTVLRRNAVAGINISERLTVFEDHFIRMHVESKGYEWKSVQVPFCYHNRHIRVEQDAHDDAYYGRLLHVHSRRWLAKHFFLWIPKLMYLCVRTRNREMVGVEWRKEKAILRATGRLMKGWMLRRRNELS